MNKEGKPVVVNKEVIKDPDLDAMFLTYERLVSTVALNNPDLKQDRIHIEAMIEKKIAGKENTAEYYRNLFEAKKPKTD